jgi:uncharacterized protein YbjT (DUF2867 family)
MIVVTGATGNVGGEVAAALVGRGEEVRAVARGAGRGGLPERVEVVRGDLDRPESLGPALGGAGGVFLLGSFRDIPGLVRTIERSGIGRVVLLTSRCVVGGAPDNAVTRMWLDAEAAVRESGVSWTILRPSGFQSNALRWLPQLRRGNVVRAPWPDVPIAAIDPADIGAVAARALTEPGFEGAALPLSGPEPLTPAGQAATLGEVLGRPLRYEPLSDEQARAEMATETPEALIDALFRFYSDGEFDDSPVVRTVCEVTGRPPRTFEQWARAHMDAFA